MVNSPILSTMNNRFTIKLYPRTDRINKKGLVPIYARIMTDRKIEVSTGKYIISSDWNENVQRLHIAAPNAETLNAYFDAFLTKILQAHTRLFLEGKSITSEILKERIFGKEEKEKTLMEVVTEHNDRFEKRIGVDYSYGSFKNYKTTKKYLAAFLKYQYEKPDMLISDVKYAFCEHYFSYLTTEMPCHVNGANKHIQRLKKIINYAYKMGYVSKNNLLSYSLKFSPFNQIKLTWEDLQKLQVLQPDNVTLSQVRDVFIFQCFTGLAYADVSQLSYMHINEVMGDKTWITMSRTKTKREFHVPLLQPAKVIFDKYFPTCTERKGLIFPVISNQKMNDNLKIIAQMAGIKKPLSSHIGRHTFATTVTLQEGIPLETVSKLLGHSKIGTTQIYGIVTQMKINKDMQGLIDKLSK